MQNIKKLRNTYTFSRGKMIGNFEGYYKNFSNPFLQTKKEKFETSKRAIVNYCQLIQSKKNKKLKVIEVGCGFGKLTKELHSLGFDAYGTDISPTAIKKAKKNSKCKFYTSDFLNEKLYLEIKPDIIILSEITWYVLPKLNEFLSFIKKKFKNKYLIHTLAIYYPGKQKYGTKYFTDLKGIIKYFDLNFIEYGEKWNSEEGRTFFLAKI